MKILVICQYYSPEPFRHPDFCEELVRRGHEVTVVAGLPNYPMGEIYDEYRHGEKRDEIINGVKVHRCFTVGRKTGAFYRFLNYYSYMLSSSHYVRRIKEEYDVVFVNQLSPVMMANAGVVYKKKHRKKMILYCLDLWPESLTAGGVPRESMVYRYFHRVSQKLYRQADRILVTSRSFSEYFAAEFNITDTGYLPQYAEEIFAPKQCTKKTDGYLDLMFAGNLGTVQSVSTVIEAARLTQDVPNLRWHIVGDGSEYENLKTQAAKLPNVLFYGRKPLEEMPIYYAQADAMLVTMQNQPLLSMTLPGKVQTYLAAGKPIIGAIGGETQKLISSSGAGVCCNAESVEELAELVRSLHREMLSEMGQKARALYDNEFSKNSFMAKLEQELQKNG